MTELNDELHFALDLAREAGEIALSYWRGDPATLKLRAKPRGGGPVTAADLEIDALCVQRIAGRFPGDEVVAEESFSAGRPMLARRRWYIDPIDGTRDFARGRPGWAVLVGLCIDEEPVLGVVHEPAASRTAWALDTAGTRRAVQTQGPIRAHEPGRGAQPLRPTDRPLSRAILAGGKIIPFTRADAIRRALEVSRDRTRRIGSVGLRIAMVARGEADAYVQPPGRTRAWDTCAAAVLATAAGARVSDIRGEPLRYRAGHAAHHHGVVVAHTAVHAEILRRLQPLAERWLPPSPDSADRGRSH